MKFIKLNKTCALGAKGATVQVADRIAKERIEWKDAVEVSEPKRKKVSNKAMSAGE